MEGTLEQIKGPPMNSPHLGLQQYFSCLKWLLTVPGPIHKYESLHNERGQAIRTVPRLGGVTRGRERPVSTHQTDKLRMKILQSEITGTQTSFSTNLGGKLSFILSFLFRHCLHRSCIYFHCSYLYNYYNYSRTLCVKC